MERLAVFITREANGYIVDAPAHCSLGRFVFKADDLSGAMAQAWRMLEVQESAASLPAPTEEKA